LSLPTPIRDAIGGAKAWIRQPAIDILLGHKDELDIRSHYDTVSAMFTDAQNADEVVIAFAFVTRGRLHARFDGAQDTQPKGAVG
jgi:hypothetical protein